MPYDVATLEKKYKVTLPARVKQFVSGKELAKYKGAKLAKPIADDGLDEYATVVFGSNDLFDTNLFDKKRHPNYIPLAALADDRGSWRLELVVLDTASGAVYFGRTVEDVDGNAPLVKVAANLDAFLKLLATK